MQLSSVPKAVARVKPFSLPLADTSKDYHRQLLREGWSPGPPASLTAVAVQVDRVLCEKSYCEECWHRGLTYQPFHRGTAYRLIGECPACGGTKEF
jgi:hypothetical protein